MKFCKPTFSLSLLLLMPFGIHAMESIAKNIIIRAGNKSIEIPKSDALSSGTIKQMVEDIGMPDTLELTHLEPSLKLIQPYFKLEYEKNIPALQAALCKHTPAKLGKLVKAFNYLDMKHALPLSIKILAQKLTAKECLAAISKSPQGTARFSLPGEIDRMLAQEMLASMPIEKALAQPIAHHGATARMKDILIPTQSDILVRSLCNVQLSPSYDRYNKVRLSEDGSLLAYSSNPNTLTLFDVVNKKIITEIQHSNLHIANILGFSKDNSSLAFQEKTGHYQYPFHIYNLTRDTFDVFQIPSLDYYTSSYRNWAINKNHTCVALSDPRQVKFINLIETTSDTFSQPSIEYPTSSTIEFSPDDTQLLHFVNAHSYGIITLINALTHQRIAQLPHEQINCFAYTSDSALLATGSWQGLLHIWDTKTGNLLQTIKAHNSTITSVGFSPKNKLIATASSDGSVKIFDMNTQKVLNSFIINNSFLGRIKSLAEKFLIPDRGIYYLQFSTDGTHLLFLTYDALHVWFPASDKHFQFPQINYRTFLEISRDSSTVLYQGKNGIEKLDLSQLPLKKWLTQTINSSQVSILESLQNSTESSTTTDAAFLPNSTDESQQAPWWQRIKNKWDNSSTATKYIGSAAAVAAGYGIYTLANKYMPQHKK